MNILTFDIEDWFQKLNHHSTRDETHWKNYPSRVVENTDHLLEILERRSQKATFFCLGWIARQYPEVLRKINEHGHEIGCHSDMHTLVFEQSPAEFKSDLEKAKKSIEDIIGEEVVSYRSPGFSLTSAPLWTFEIIADMGFLNDCSIAPHVRITQPEIRLVPLESISVLNVNGRKLREFPLSSFNLLGYRLIFSGGGYFRLIPYPVIRTLMKQSDYVMTYLHPHDLDPNQPVIKDLPAFRKFKSTTGLHKAEDKLKKMITEFNFIDLRGAVEKIDWNSVQTIRIK